MMGQHYFEKLLATEDSNLVRNLELTLIDQPSYNMSGCLKALKIIPTSKCLLGIQAGV